MKNLEILFIILGAIALLMSAVCLWMIIDINKVRKQFFAGKTSANLEEFIINQNKKINDMAKRGEEVEDQLAFVKEQQKLAIQKIGLIRYNPFQDDGGNQSFSIALLDEKQNGLVLTSLHGREANRIYAKPLKKAKSEFSLTEEEKKAIESAKNF